MNNIKKWPERMYADIKTLSPTHAMQAEIRELRAALAAHPQQEKASAPVSVPEGWKLVPRQLTEEQSREIVYNINRKYKGNPMSDFLAREVWSWGIYAAPAAPVAEPQQVAQHADLLPCPFCGSAAAIQEHEPHTHNMTIGDFKMPDHPGSFTIECMGAGCNTGQIADTRDEAVAMWNRRAAGQQAVVEQPVAEQGAPDYSEMSREALERHAARMAQALANDRSRQFYDKHATGPMMPPSCLCCGQLPDKVAIRHAELPGIVVCETCRAAIAAAQQLVDEHGELPPIPVGICFSEQHCNFYRADTGQDMGNEFYDKWRDRADEFPDRATARAALAKKGGS